MSYIRPYDIAVFVDRNGGIACRIHCVFIVSAKAVVLFIVGRFNAVVLRRKIGIILTAGYVGGCILLSGRLCSAGAEYCRLYLAFHFVEVSKL